MENKQDLEAQLQAVRAKALKQRMIIIASTAAIVICCFAVGIYKYNVRETHQRNLQHQAEAEAKLQKQSELDAELKYEQWLKEIKEIQRHDSIAALSKVDEPAPNEPNYTFDDIEKMVRKLSNEDYSAVVWCEEHDSPKWVVQYTKGGKKYFRHFNAEKKTYGPKVRLTQEDIGKFHVHGNKRDRYYYGNGGTLIHSVNGVPKETFYNLRTIDLFTPEPAPDGYESWEDYYYDNEEDLKLYYYGR